MRDYHDIVNSIGPNPSSVPGHVSFEVTWAGGGARQKVRDDTYDFGGDFVTGAATIAFTVSDDGSGVSYTADAAGQSNGLPPGVGHERNGVFFQ
jgi:hypothetical protein